MCAITASTSANNTNRATDINSSELVAEIIEWLYNLTNVFEEKSRELELATGLSKNHVLAIKLISRTPFISVSGLAKQMDINSVTIVRILDRLERLEIITRIRSNKDRRVVELKIAEKANDFEQILDNMTHDVLMCCLGATDNSELKQKLGPLQLITSYADTAESLQSGKI